MSKKNFMKAMGQIDDRILERYGEFEEKLPARHEKKRIIRMISLAASIALMLSVVLPVMLFIAESGREPERFYEYSQMNGAALQYLTAREFDSERSKGKVSSEFKNAAADFAVRLLQESASDYEGDGLLVSPLSVMLALTMAANGAEGETLDQLEDAIGRSLDIEELNEQLFNYTSSLVSSKDAKINLANSVWVTSSPSFSVNKHYLAQIENTFDADIIAADFADPDTTDAINNWVKDETFDMIDKIVNDGELNAETVMVLLNAIAFDALWKEQVATEACYDDIFKGTEGDETVKFMYTNCEAYIKGSDEVGIVKEYEGGKYAFVALLPDEDIAISDYVASLTGKKFLKLYNNKKEISRWFEVWAKMPHFSYDCSIDMNDVLGRMGISDAFDSETADFTSLGKSENGNVYIGRVIHKTHIDLDNSGTRAAAVTALYYKDGSLDSITPKIKEVYLDRPFVYAIVDTATGLPIFLGVCENIQ